MSYYSLYCKEHYGGYSEFRLQLMLLRHVGLQVKSQAMHRLDSSRRWLSAAEFWDLGLQAFRGLRHSGVWVAMGSNLAIYDEELPH